MTYTVFALKWRPNNFSEIVGQPHIVSTLQSAFEKDRLAHAYIFAGPRGVGKTSTARIFAKALNCQKGPTANPCNVCSSCTQITQGRSLDVIEIDGASNRGIDEIRTLRENVKFAPAQGKYKVYIIDEVHMLTTEAFNALLKTLEEPPEFVKFIFATTQVNKILPTILSRCQRMDFRRITATEISQQLSKIVESEKIKVDKDVLFAIAKASDGALRDAESVLDQLVSVSNGTVTIKDAVSVLGLIEQDTLFAITDALINHNAAEALTIFNSIIDNGKDVLVFLTNLVEHYRNLMIAKVSKADQTLIDLPKDLCDKLLSQSALMSLEEIMNSFTVLTQTQEMSKRFDLQRIPVEIALVRLSQEKKKTTHAVSSPTSSTQNVAIKSAPVLKPAVSVIPVSMPAESRPVISQPVKEQHPPKPQASVGHHQVSHEPVVSLEQVQEVWQALIEKLSTVKMSLSTFLTEGIPVKMHGNTLTIEFSKSHSLHKDSLEKKDNKQLVEKYLSELLGVNILFHCVLTTRIDRKPDQETTFLKSAINAFNGRVIGE